jgi:hypothetical protein
MTLLFSAFLYFCLNECNNDGNVVVSYVFEAHVTFASTHKKKDGESNPLRSVHVSGGN